MDQLVRNALFGSPEEQKEARKTIYDKAKEKGVILSSIQPLYEALGRGEVKGFTVPALNLRTLTYDMARAVIRAIKALDAGPFIFEIARSEIGYTQQPPEDYAVACLAAAIQENWKGPLFIQGDHFQVKAKAFKKDREKEIEALKKLMREAIQAGFYNIDIDASTLVDLSFEDLKDQQKLNYELTAEFTRYIRSLEPEGITISLGGEIGEVGGKNSTPEELRAFMDGYLERIDGKGLSKISVQTGTTHGGVVLPDGSIAKVKIDFDTLKTLSKVAREEYGLAGAVQHGASTLPDEAFDKFPEVATAEIHLATAFQNLIYEHPSFPKDLKDTMMEHIKTHHKDEWKEGQTEEQFLYKTRKKAWGPFKKEVWNLDEAILAEIREHLEEKFRFIFEKLRIRGTAYLLEKYF